MDTDKLVADYKKAKQEFERLAIEMQDVFTEMAKKAIQARNWTEAYGIAYRCPDEVARAFILDAIRQGMEKT
mgnify:CR=1 FL=1